MLHRPLLRCSLAALGLAFATGSALAESPPAGPQVAGQLLRQHCTRCHGAEQQESELRLDKLDMDIAYGKDSAVWHAVAERLMLGEMPPAGQPRPSPHTAGRVIAWLKPELAKAGHDLADAERKIALPQHGNQVDHDALFAAGTQVLAASPARIWRNSPQIYSAWSSRLTKNRTSISQPFSASSAEGIKDYAALFTIDEPTIAQLLRNAQSIVELQVHAAGGIKEIKSVVLAKESPSGETVDGAIRKEFQLVLQREPTAEELARFASLAEKNVASGGQETGMKATLAAVFLLPEALYRLELGGGEADEHGRRTLATRELALAIGLALSDAGPDGRLLKAAEEGRLATTADVQREVDRLLKDPKFQKPRIMRFFDEYFEYTAAADVFKDLNRGEWRPEILIGDTRNLIQRILDEDRDVLKRLLTTRESFVNYRLDAKLGPQPARIANKKDNKPPDPKKPPKPRTMEYSDLYNMPDDWEFVSQQPINLPADQRAGILTQPSWLAAFATNNENHAIRRGKWIRERLLGSPIPDLPITVDAQLPDAPEKSLRERMEITKQAYCWQCHQKMNPLGLAFESYDYLGRHRTEEPVVDLEATAANVDKNGKPKGNVLREVAIDSTLKLEGSGETSLDGEYATAVELIDKLADSPRVRQVFVRHAFRYWLGRNETLDDAATLVAADQAYVNSGGSMNALIASLLASDSFLYRKYVP